MSVDSNFRIDTLQSGSATTIRLGGELDSATCPTLLEHFERAAASAGEVMLDLGAVSFIDSAGMRAIIVLERTAGERGVSLTIVPPPEPVTELLQVAGIADRLALRPRGEGAPPDTRFTDRVELELPQEPSAPGRARAEVRQVVRGRLSEDACATAILLVSELVTNAVIHAGETAHGSIGLRITTYVDRIRVEVSDRGAGFELEQLPPRPRATGGHGLFVVDGLASRWGTNRVQIDDQPRFCVWFELDGDATEPAASTLPDRAERDQDPDEPSLATAET